MKHPSLRRARPAHLLLSAVALLVAAPAAAQADIPISSLKAGPVTAFNNLSGLPVTSTAPTDPARNDFNCSPLGGALSTQAGATTDYCISFTVTPGDPITGEDIHDTLVQLPVGTQAQIDLAAKCTEAQFARDAITPNTCTPESQVGTALAQLTTPASATPQTSPGRIYALETPAGKAAKFGVALIASAPSAAAPTTPVTETKFTITVSQLGDPKIGLQNQTDQLSKTIQSAPSGFFPDGKVPIAINGTSLRFWGSAAAHPHVVNPFAPVQTLPPVSMSHDFFIVGTTCQTDQTVSLTINPYTDTPTNAGSKPTSQSTTYKLSGCGALPFDPDFQIGLSGETNPGGHPGLGISIRVPEGQEDLGSTKITLPLGVATDLSRIQNQCPLATFMADACGTATIIGTVNATLTGINADVVTGDVQMVKVDGQTLPALGFDFNGRLPLRIAGKTSIDSSGRIVNTFSDLPSIPQRSLDVQLYGGGQGILQISTAKCQVSSYDASVVGQNGKFKNFTTPTKCGESFTASIKNDDTTKPTLQVNGTGATGKKIDSLRVTLPAGLTVNRNVSKTGFKISGIEKAVTKDPSHTRLDKKTYKVTIGKPGSNGFSILTRSRTLGASKAFTKRSAAFTVLVRVVYTDGTKVNVNVPVSRK